MLILRRLTKLFARRDVFPDSLRKEYEPKDLNGKKLVIHIERSNQFNQQYKKNFSNQTRIDKFIKELRSKPTSRFEDAGDNFADTHYLASYSNTITSNISKRFVMFSKKITNADRFNYRIYLPELVEDKTTEEKYYFQKIVLDSCSEHTISGKSGSYLHGEEQQIKGNVWHSPNKSAKKKRKLIKLNKQKKN